MRENFDGEALALNQRKLSSNLSLSTRIPKVAQMDRAACYCAGQWFEPIPQGPKLGGTRNIFNW